MFLKIGGQLRRSDVYPSVSNVEVFGKKEHTISDEKASRNRYQRNMKRPKAIRATGRRARLSMYM
jgi:hypothetical protein